MSFPRYPEYKDSGVEWLGEVPGHWEVLSLKKSFKIVGGSTPKSENDSYWDGDILWATPSDLSKRESIYMSDTQRKITATGLASCGTSIVPASSIILSTRAPIGSLAIAEMDMCTNQGCKSLVPTKFSNTEYFAHLLSISTTELNIRGKGTTFLELSSDELGAFKTPVPPLPEQTQIAALLDRETAKIDELVAEQRLLMALLKEKRQAVISHAVTQGLNPDAPMKPSGIEWLGDVPEHWRVVPLRWAAKCCSGDGLSSTEVESIDDDEHTVRVIGGNGLMGFTDQKNVDHSLLAVGRVGALCGNVHLVHPPAWITDNALVLDPDSSIFDLQFLSMTLRSRNLNDIASKTAQPLITGTQVSDQRIPCPPLPEQEVIVIYLKEQSAKFDTLTTEAQRAVDLLQERRTALISAAVTGQIDVRGAAI